MTVRHALRRLIWKFGYDLRYQPQLRFGSLGLDQFEDAKHHVRTDRPVILDVGANVGQTIVRARKYWPASVIHSFEPSEATFEILKKNTEGMRDLYINQCALGPEEGHAPFLLYADSRHSSLLPPGTCAPSPIIGSQSVSIQTVDGYCAERGIESIDILKIDTQGFDLQVLRGSMRLLCSTTVVFVELIFSDTYVGQPPYYEAMRFLHDNGFVLGGLYDVQYAANVADWADSTFCRRDC